MEMDFNHSCPADRKVFVRPLNGSKQHNELWLLLVAGYDLINANSKWQFKSDNVLLDIGLQHVSEIPQSLVQRDKGGSVVLLVIKNCCQHSLIWN